MEPWNFLLLLKRFVGFNMGDVGSFHYTSLWVRAFIVPPSGMILEVGILLEILLVIVYRLMQKKMVDT